MTTTAIQQLRKPTNTARLTRQLKRGLLYLLLSLGGMVVCFPFVWMILTSFKTYGEAIATPPTLFPQSWGLYLRVLGRMLLTYPLLPILLLGWLAAGYWIIRKLPAGGWRWAYGVLHLVLFFALGSLSLLGPLRLPALWQATAQRLGVQPPAFWGNYVEAWDRAPFAAYFRNSVIMSLATPLLIVATSAPAAYAFARLNFPAKNLLFMLYLVTMMVPTEVLLIPNFITITELHWKNTYWALIVPSAVSVVTIFFLRQFFLSIPNDLFDAAVIDGSGHVRFLISIAMPLAQPALVSTAMFNFLGSWNSLLWPLLVTDKDTMRPIALGLASFSTEAATHFQLYMAAATFTIIPILLIFMLVQRQFIEGIARTGIK